MKWNSVLICFLSQLVGVSLLYARHPHPLSAYNHTAHVTWFAAEEETCNTMTFSDGSSVTSCCLPNGDCYTGPLTGYRIQLEDGVRGEITDFRPLLNPDSDPLDLGGEPECKGLPMPEHAACIDPLHDEDFRHTMETIKAQAHVHKPWTFRYRIRRTDIAGTTFENICIPYVKDNVVLSETCYSKP